MLWLHICLLLPTPFPPPSPCPLQAFLITDEKTGKIDFVGNRTECALLLMLQKVWGQDYKAMRDMHHAATVGACRACLGGSGAAGW